MLNKKRKVLIAALSTAIIVICGLIAIYSMRGLSLLNTSVDDSLKIFTQITLQNDFTDASKVGLGSPATIKQWQDNNLQINKDYFKNEFKNTLSDEKLNQLAAAELDMNKKRIIKISDVKITGDTATATVNISKVNYSAIVDTAVKNLTARKEQENLSSPEKLSAALADELISGYENAKPSDEMTSFSVTCQKGLINNDVKHSGNDLAKASDTLAKYIFPYIAGHYWYPQNFDDYFANVTRAVES